MVAAWLEQGPRRYWWLSAAAISVVERIVTFSYFIPTMLWLQGTDNLPQTQVAMDAPGLRSSWSHSGGVAGGTEGVIVAG